mgnify:FL=1
MADIDLKARLPILKNRLKGGYYQPTFGSTPISADRAPDKTANDVIGKMLAERGGANPSPQSQQAAPQPTGPVEPPLTTSEYAEKRVAYLNNMPEKGTPEGSGKYYGHGVWENVAGSDADKRYKEMAAKNPIQQEDPNKFFFNKNAGPAVYESVSPGGSRSFSDSSGPGKKKIFGGIDTSGLPTRKEYADFMAKEGEAKAKAMEGIEPKIGRAHV